MVTSNLQGQVTLQGLIPRMETGMGTIPAQALAGTGTGNFLARGDRDGEAFPGEFLVGISRYNPRANHDI